MKLYTIALNGCVLKGYQIVVDDLLLAYHSLQGLSKQRTTQLFFNTFEDATNFLKTQSTDKIHIWFDTDAYLLEEFDVYPVEIEIEHLSETNVVLLSGYHKNKKELP